MSVESTQKKAHEGDVVELLVDLPESNFRAGQRGIVVSEFEEPEEAYDLEMEDQQGNFLGFAYSIKPEHIVNLSMDALRSGLVYLNEGKILEAKREFENAIELRPGLIGTLHNLLMMALAGNEDWETAVVCMRLLLELNPAYVHARDSLAVSYLNWGVQVAKQGDKDNAFFLFLRASGITSSPDVNARIRQNFAASCCNFGAQAFREGDVEKARELMRAACSYYPSTEVRQNLAVSCIHAARFYMARGPLQRAIDAFEEAEEVGLVSPDFINDYAIALVFVGRLDDARRAFERALAIAPSDRIIRSNLNRLLHQEAAESFVREEKNYDFVPIELVAQGVNEAAVTY